MLAHLGKGWRYFGARSNFTPPAALIGLLLLKHVYGLSYEDVCKRAGFMTRIPNTLPGITVPTGRVRARLVKRSSR